MLSKKTTKILLILAIIGVIGLIVISLNSFQIIKKTQTSDKIPEELVSTFSQQFQNKFINEVGQPIEGFEPSMFMRVYPGLENSDFNMVKTLEGIYFFNNEELTFKRVKEFPISSVEKAISEEGMLTLLQNIVNRLDIQVTDLDSLTQIISSLEEPVKTFCNEDQRNVDFCIEIYQPVCGWNDPSKINCITSPCADTYGNSCKACSNENVLYYISGECPKVN